MGHEFETTAAPQLNKTISVTISYEIFNWLLSVATASRLFGPAEAAGFILKSQRDASMMRPALNEPSSVRLIRLCLSKLEDNKGMTIKELFIDSGFGAQTVKAALDRLGHLGEVDRRPRDHANRTSVTGYSPTEFFLTARGVQMIELHKEQAQKDEEKRRADAIPFVDVRAGKLEAFRVVVAAYAAQEAKSETEPSEENAIELERLAGLFTEAMNACAEWPTDRAKVVEDFRKAAALAKALKP